MGLKSFVTRQLGRPSGWFAPIAARLLNKGNARQNDDCLDALGLEPHFRVLDIGFGGGVSFERLLSACSEGSVVGSEISTEMVTRARSRFADAIDAGRLVVVEASAAALGFDDGSFDRIMSVNTLYFWPDLAAGLSEVHRVLAPGGRFVTSLVPAAMLAKIGFAEQGFRTEPPEFYARALQQAGFVDVRQEATGDSKGSVLVVASRAG